MKYTEKENFKQLDNKEQNIITLAFNFVKSYDEDFPVV